MPSSSAVRAASESSTNLGDLGHAPASNAPSPRAASSDLTPAPEAGLAQSAPQIQPMSDQTAAASENNSSENHDATAAAGSYGTRSRNRPRGQRPNYADDKEIDLEIEAAGKYTKSSKRSSAASASAAAPTYSQEMESAGSRNGFAIVNGTGAIHPPTVSTMNGTQPSAPASNATSKKRKQPGSSVTVSAAANSPAPIAPQVTTVSESRMRFIESNVMSFSNSKARLNKQQELVADDGTAVAVNDHLYFVCEPPGEPYYFGRIMEFLHVNNDSAGPVEAVRVNWFYRPKDIQRRVQDTRVVFASMHSDTCPLTSMRGKCYIQHLADISDLEEFRKQPDSFWFDKLYDRYMQRYYEVIPTSKVVNVPRHVKKVLDERWKFVLVEVGRGRDLTSASKVCKRCADFASNHESVDCAVCKNTYHMSCVRPPLLKKPARGFAWACAACSRAQELKMEARNTPLSENELSKLAEAESFDEDEDSQPQDLTTRENSAGPDEHPPPSASQLAQATLWPWRYLGIHSRPEDALDIDDRIYPRASSRLGPRHQANVNVWHGQPVEFIKPAEAKKRYKPTISTKKDAKAAALLENDKREKRPKWVFDEPPGFVHRGLDEPVDIKGKKEYSAQLTFKMPDASKFTERGLDNDERPADYENIVDAYLQRCEKEIGPKFRLGQGNVDLRTKALEKLQDSAYDVEKAMEAMSKISIRTDLKLPDLTKDEIKKFEEGVAKYGSELHLVARHVSPTIKEGRIVRFYYMWKKTPRGEEIWGSYEGRKSKRDSKRVEKDANGARLMDDVGDDGDDSAFDEHKASKVKRSFKCKFCSTTSSRVWRRAPGTAPGTLVPRDPNAKNAKDKSNWLVSALCGKCAYLWRRYAVQYESIEEIGKKIAIAGGRASKRKVDEELMRIVLEAHAFAGDILSKAIAQTVTSAGIDVPLEMIESDEPAKKKIKPEGPVVPIEVAVEKKKSVPEKPVELEPLQPEMPRVKEHPCAVCHVINHHDFRILKCRDCRLHVHGECYGITNLPVANSAWFCDMCKNDHNTQVSTNYECVLCPVRITPQELMEPPKISHKKKSDRERDKEKKEREMVQEAGRRWREDQLAAGRPVDPREPLKRTAWNNWMHVNCAVWTKEIKFGDTEHLDSAEGVGFIPKERFDTPCKFCNDTGFPTVGCSYDGCNVSFHVGCAHQRRLTMGFGVSDKKPNRRDSAAVLKFGSDNVVVAPAIWCLNHSPKKEDQIYSMLEEMPSGLTLLQEYVRTYKRVDESTTGTVRRAAQFISDAAIQPLATINAPNRRMSLVNGHNRSTSTAGGIVASPSPSSPQMNGHYHGPNNTAGHGKSTRAEKKCCTCLTQFSPKWYKVERDAIPPINGQDLRPGQPSHQSTEAEGGRSSHSAQPPSPVLNHVLPPMQHNHHAHAPPGLLIKPEPIDVDALDVPEEVLFQCHKCRVDKKTPPSSPSQVRRKDVHQNSVARSPVGQPAVYPPSHSVYSLAPPDAPAHSHPPVQAGGPPPHVYQNGTPAWSAQPIRNGQGPGAPAPYGQPLYQPPGEFRYPYPAPSLYAAHGGLPHPTPRPNGLPQHSPPPGPFATPLPGQPTTVIPPGQPASPLMTNGASAFPGRPARPPYSEYIPPRAFGGPPPLPPPQRAPSLSLTQMAQSATEIVPVRRSSQDGATGPGLGLGRSLVNDIPHNIAAGVGRDDQSREAERERDARSSTAGPGASASPSLRNLLS